MSLLKYVFDTEWKQRRDIEELREMQYRMALAPSGGASEKWVQEIAEEVKELAATVTVLMRRLHEAKLLDVAAIQAEVAEELRPRPRTTKPRADKPAPPAGPITDETCTKCGTQGTSDQMVRVGSAWYCRPCARNP